MGNGVLEALVAIKGQDEMFFSSRRSTTVEILYGTVR